MFPSKASLRTRTNQSAILDRNAFPYIYMRSTDV
jgi:hypothetical protein